MVQFIVKDFQSIEEAKISVNGLTLIVGQSNMGKSACLRALIAATTNRFKSNQVRHGQDHATVKVKYSDSDDVLIVQRSYTGGSPLMKLGNLTFSKLSRTLPAQVSDFNNFGFLKVTDSESYSLNFHEQFQKPLLLEYSQKKVMDILSASKGIDDLNIVKEALSQKRAENRGAFSSVDSIINDTNVKLSKVKSNLDLLEDTVTALSEVYDTAKESEKSKELVVRLSSLLSDYQLLSARINLVSSLLANVSKLNSEFDLLKSFELLSEDLHKETLIKFRIAKLNKFVSSYNPDLDSKKSLLTDLSAKLTKLIAMNESESLLNSRLSLSEVIISVSSSIKELTTTLNGFNNLVSEFSHKQVLESRISELENFTVNKICPICGSKFE